MIYRLFQQGIGHDRESRQRVTKSSTWRAGTYIVFNESRENSADNVVNAINRAAEDGGTKYILIM